MREKEFTSAPWRVEGLNIIGDDNSIVSSINPWDYSGTKSEDIANAHLTAAAPEILEALEVLAVCVADTSDEETINALHKAGAAVRKAYGGTS